MNPLLLLLIIPLLTIGVIILTDKAFARIVAAAGMSVQLAFTFVLLYLFYQQRGLSPHSSMVFTSSTNWYKAYNICLTFGIDGISMAMITLTSIVTFAGVFVSWQVTEKVKEFFISLILLAGGVFGFFISLDLFTMFLFYELAVIPMYLLIGIWGTGPKEYSAMKLTLMLMGGSALLLVGILGIYFNSAPEGMPLTFDIIEISRRGIPFSAQMLFFPVTFIGFGILGALFPFHTWSPDGHASAPTAVSMLHAGVLMKLGGYGCFRVAIGLMPQAAAELGWIFIVLTSLSVVYGAFGAIWQKDLKYINAYSSVSHCGLVLFALLMLNETASTGAFLQMISHGLMTALFFALIGMIYGRTHTRMIDQMGGLMKVIPFLSVLYVMAGLASLGLPGLSGFAAEMTIFVGAFQHADTFHRVATILVCSSIVITAVYILRVVATLLLGPVREASYTHLEDATWFEKVGGITLLLSIIIIGIVPLWLMDLLSNPVENLLQTLKN
jgi:NADH-quinone oxidoreductase subunit M